MLAIARPNPLPHPHKKESRSMLRRVQSPHHVAAGARSPHHSMMSRSTSQSHSRSNPSTSGSSMSLREALAKARNDARYQRSADSSRSNGSHTTHGGTSLREALARAEQRRVTQGRANPEHTAFGRANPTAFGSTVSLRGLLEEHARQNGKKRARKPVRRNEATGLVDRDALLADYRTRKTAYDKAVTEAQKSPTPRNKMIVDRQRKVLEEFRKILMVLSPRMGESARRSVLVRRSARSAQPSASFRMRSAQPPRAVAAQFAAMMRRLMWWTLRSVTILASVSAA